MAEMNIAGENEKLSVKFVAYLRTSCRVLELGLFAHAESEYKQYDQL